MIKLFRGRSRFVVLALLVLVLGVAVYGFAAANTVPGGNAGEGAGTISGYIVSNVSYTLNASYPSSITQVDFDMDAVPAALQVGIDTVVGGSITWADSCTINSATDISCQFTGVSTSTAGELIVIAGDVTDLP